jgi:hemerythrin
MMEQEHQRLHEMVAGTLALITNKRGVEDRMSSLDALRARLIEHFAAEEEYAKPYDSDLHQALHDGHTALLALVDRAKASLAQGKEAEAKQLLAHFGEALAHHDADVDTPLFRLMARGSWAGSAHHWNQRVRG